MERPRMVFADDEGRIYDHPELEMCGMAGTRHSTHFEFWMVVNPSLIISKNHSWTFHDPPRSH